MSSTVCLVVVRHMGHPSLVATAPVTKGREGIRRDRRERGLSPDAFNVKAAEVVLCPVPLQVPTLSGIEAIKVLLFI